MGERATNPAEQARSLGRRKLDHAFGRHLAESNLFDDGLPNLRVLQNFGLGREAFEIEVAGVLGRGVAAETIFSD